MSTKIFKRKRIIINPSFQFRLITFFFFISVFIAIAILLFSLREYSSFKTSIEKDAKEMSLYTELVNEYIDPMVTVYYIPKDKEKEIFIRLTSFIFLLSFIVILFGVIISHRIAGPLYRLNQTMIKASKDKEVPHLKFRSKDEFKNLADSFNNCFEYWNNKYVVSSDTLKKVIMELEQVRELVNDEDIKTKLNTIIENTNQKKLM